MEANFKKDNENFDLSQQAEYERRIEAIQSEWKRQGDMIKQLDSTFDIEEAFENPEFYDLVVNKGNSVTEAYSEVYAKRPRRSISEIGNLTNGVCPSANHDIKSMSDREFEEYIRKIKNS